jgi:hypothetical protein
LKWFVLFGLGGDRRFDLRTAKQNLQSCKTPSTGTVHGKGTIEKDTIEKETIGKETILDQNGSDQ